MGFILRAHWLVGMISLGLEVLGCGQVGGTSAGEGSSHVGGAGAGEGSSDGLPAATDRYAFAKSGDRLQALGYTSDGAAQFRTFHDSLLDFDCEFVSGKSCGDRQCVPTRSAQLIFLDASCSEPATWTPFQAAQPGDWVSVVQPSSECPGAPSVRDTFELGEQIYPEAVPPSAAPLVYELRGGRCVVASPAAKSIPAVQRLFPRAATELVAARPVSFDVGGGLRLSRLLGEDGSELTVAVTDAAGEACTVVPNGQCLTPGGDASGTSFPMTEMIHQGTGAAHIDLFISVPGAGRVGVPVARFPDMLDFADDAGNRCEVLHAIDGTLRCASVVPSPLETSIWADPGCTRRLYYGYQSDVDPSTLRANLHAESGALIAVSTLKPYTGPLYGHSDGACIRGPEDGSEDAMLLELDQRIEASALPQVFETTL
jgi:hypothetical protein